jgi:hypothetical protein
MAPLACPSSNHRERVTHTQCDHCGGDCELSPPIAVGIKLPLPGALCTVDVLHGEAACWSHSSTRPTGCKSAAVIVTLIGVIVAWCCAQQGVGEGSPRQHVVCGRHAVIDRHTTPPAPHRRKQIKTNTTALRTVYGNGIRCFGYRIWDPVTIAQPGRSASIYRPWV